LQLLSFGGLEAEQRRGASRGLGGERPETVERLPAAAESAAKELQWTGWWFGSMRES